jgi:hypothetical protein
MSLKESQDFKRRSSHSLSCASDVTEMHNEIMISRNYYIEKKSY